MLYNFKKHFWCIPWKISLRGTVYPEFEWFGLLHIMHLNEWVVKVRHTICARPNLVLLSVCPCRKWHCSVHIVLPACIVVKLLGCLRGRLLKQFPYFDQPAKAPHPYLQEASTSGDTHYRPKDDALLRMEIMTFKEVRVSITLSSDTLPQSVRTKLSLSK